MKSILSKLIKPQADLINVTKLQELRDRDIIIQNSDELDLVDKEPNMNMKSKNLEENLS
jgi:hypothetical protein